MAIPILPDPDEAEQQLVQSFHEFVSTHWFFNGREKGNKIVHKGQNTTFMVIDEMQRGENFD